MLIEQLVILGYRDDSLETVKRNHLQYNLPLKILSYEDLYGWTMDKIVKQVHENNKTTRLISYPLYIIGRSDLKNEIKVWLLSSVKLL